MNNPLIEIANRLIPYMPGWELKPPKPDGHYAEFVRGDHAEITIQHDRTGKMYHLSGGVDNTFPSGLYADFPRINVNRSKTAYQIAQDIHRRLIPALDAVMPALIERKRRTEEHAILNENNAARLSRLMGNKEPYREHGYYKFSISNYIGEPGDHQCYARAEIAGDRIKLQLENLTMGEAEVILRMVNGLPPFPEWGSRTTQ